MIAPSFAINRDFSTTSLRQWVSKMTSAFSLPDPSKLRTAPFCLMILSGSSARHESEKQKRKMETTPRKMPALFGFVETTEMIDDPGFQAGGVDLTLVSKNDFTSRGD